MPAVHPKAKMIPACALLAISRPRKGRVTYQDDVRERKKEKRSLEVLPISRLVLRLIIPQPQLLHQRALLVAGVDFTNAFGRRGMCRSETLLTIFLVGGLTHIVDNYLVLGVWKLITFIEEEARKYCLFETAEKEKEYAGFDDGCDPVRPPPAKSICDGSASDKSETRSGSACDSMDRRYALILTLSPAAVRRGRTIDWCYAGGQRTCRRSKAE
jgi:hypothetical protein